VNSAFDSVSAMRFQVFVQFKIWDGSFERVVDFAQNVVDAVALGSLGVVGVNNGVGDAAEGGGEVDGEFLEGFGCASAEDEERVLCKGILEADCFVVLVEEGVFVNLMTGQETIVEECEENYDSDHYLKSTASA
jgi:hypothetical protein